MSDPRGLELSELPSRDSDESTVVDPEAEPFLSTEDGGKAFRTSSSAPTPLPMRQLMILCLVRVVEPISFTQVFPYVNEMIDDLHLTDDPARLGFYSGLVESTFAISQLFSIYHWARLSDKIGRVPVITLGIGGVALTTLFLGMSKSLMGIMIARFLAGLAAGNTAVIHSVLGELTDSTNQATAFPIYGLTWPVGSVIGPIIGGTFAHAATKFPSLFDVWLFREHPYLLPGMIAAAVAMTGSLLAFFQLEETLPSKAKRSFKRDPPSSKLARDEGPLSIKQLFSVPVLRSLCLSGAFLANITTAYDVVFVLFCYTPIKTGGLSFTSLEIGYCLAMSGVISIGIQIFILPVLLRRFSPARIYMTCMKMWPLAFICMPLLNVIARTGVDAATGKMLHTTAPLTWMGIIALILWTRIACIAYSVNMILVRDNAPSPAALGSTNGLVQLCMSFARAWSPAFVSSMFALSIENHLLRGQLWVVVMVGISLLGIAATRRVGRGVTLPTRP